MSITRFKASTSSIIAFPGTIALTKSGLTTSFNWPRFIQPSSSTTSFPIPSSCYRTSSCARALPPPDTGILHILSYGNEAQTVKVPSCRHEIQLGKHSTSLEKSRKEWTSYKSRQKSIWTALIRTERNANEKPVDGNGRMNGFGTSTRVLLPLMTFQVC